MALLAAPDRWPGRHLARPGIAPLSSGVTTALLQARWHLLLNLAASRPSALATSAIHRRFPRCIWKCGRLSSDAELNWANVMVSGTPIWSSIYGRNAADFALAGTVNRAWALVLVQQYWQITASHERATIGCKPACAAGTNVLCCGLLKTQHAANDHPELEQFYRLVPATTR